MALVSADQIKTVTGREPRLMAKFDTRESRPQALASSTVLPLSNGAYALVAGDGYFDVPAASSVKHWPTPTIKKRLQTLPWQAGPSSESQALDMAVASGML